MLSRESCLPYQGLTWWTGHYNWQKPLGMVRQNAMLRGGQSGIEHGHVRHKHPGYYTILLFRTPAAKNINESINNVLSHLDNPGMKTSRFGEANPKNMAHGGFGGFLLEHFL